MLNVPTILVWLLLSVSPTAGPLPVARFMSQQECERVAQELSKDAPANAAYQLRCVMAFVVK